MMIKSVVNISNNTQLYSLIAGHLLLELTAIS